jgi:small RNA 2'-O-methyltransferase
MFLLRISSENPNLSFILNKNPGDGMQVKKMRQGLGFGWYENESVYNLLFQDGFDEVSFGLKGAGGKQFEYMDLGRYCNPLIACTLLREFLGRAAKGAHVSDIEEYAHRITLPCVWVSDRCIDMIPKYLAGEGRKIKFIRLDQERGVDGCFELNLDFNGSLSDALNLIDLICLLLSFDLGGQYTLELPLLEKYIQTLIKLDAPYIIRYLFKLNLIRSHKVFEKCRHLLNSSEKYNFKFEFDSTENQRLDFVIPLLDPKKPIIDIGCGTGKRMLFLAGKGTKVHAINSDKEVLEELAYKARLKKLDNLFVYTSLESLLNSDYSEGLNGLQLLLIQAFEDIKLEEAEELLQRCAEVDFETMIITMPNRDFEVNNRSLFEMNGVEFEKFIRSHFERGENTGIYSLEIGTFGDSVDGQAATSFAIIRANKPSNKKGSSKSAN